METGTLQGDEGAVELGADGLGDSPIGQLGLRPVAGWYRLKVLGTAAALTAADIDFLQHRVRLHRNAVKVGGRFEVESLKSNKNRTVALPAFVVDALALTAQGKSRDGLMWPSEAGSYPAPPSSTGSWLSGAVARCRAADETSPRVTAHDLRHTAASLAISAGANPKVVQRMLGHASAAMTLDVYADLFESDIDAVAENVAKMWPQRVAAR